MKPMDFLMISGEIKVNKVAQPLKRNLETIRKVIMIHCVKCPNNFFLVRIRKNTDQKKSVFGHFSQSDKLL